ncbi:hypothetical protein WJX84_012353 [Apatococcus fuscideae]|uniref:VPS8-like TPR-like repeats domain-containing protein n=1 Tax=Apatococcus fuscideae TaxID=2026836 RepID=A0AAW1S169_9CHLO
MCELYIRLLCQFNATAVLPFLQGHDAYRVEMALACCQQHGIPAAEAYLLERQGDIPAALAIFISEINKANMLLTTAVKSGRVTLPRTAPREAGGKGAGIAAFLHRAAAYHPGLSRASSLQDPTNLPVGPQNEVMAAQTALRNAIALCERHVRDSAAEVSHSLWFEVLAAYVGMLRRVRNEEHKLARPSSPKKVMAPQGSLERPLDMRRLMSPEALKAASQHGLLRSPVGSGNAGAAIARTPSGQAAAVTQTERLAALQQLLTAFMEEAISHMAGHIPLRIIAERILAHHATDQFGDFRGTLLGLLAAYAYESSILAAATRLVSSDAFHALFSLYQSHTRYSQPSQPDEDGETSRPGSKQLDCRVYLGPRARSVAVLTMCTLQLPELFPQLELY